MVRVPSLDALVGAHPDALRDLFDTGRMADATELATVADTTKLAEAAGRVLAFEGLANVHALTGSFVRAIANHLVPWRGGAFDAGGTTGRHLLFGRSATRFRCEPEPSNLDGRTALVFRHDGVGNLWPATSFVCELRRVDEGVLIGPGFRRASKDKLALAFWWGIEA
ncbi:MAG: hypothetical protein EXR75_00880 [Myxococcales bacterium]|nr:hypothetical protein [Myxococcales bacterium]